MNVTFSGASLGSSGALADVARDHESAVRYVGCGPDHFREGLVWRKPTDAEDLEAVRHRLKSSLDLEPTRRLVHLYGLSSPFMDDIDPLLRRDHGAVNVFHQPSMKGLKPGGECVSLCAKSPRVAIQHHGAPKQSAAREHYESGHDWRIGHHEAPRPATGRIANRVQGGQRRIGRRGAVSSRLRGGIGSELRHPTRWRSPGNGRSQRPRPGRTRGV